MKLVHEGTSAAVTCALITMVFGVALAQGSNMALAQEGSVELPLSRYEALTGGAADGPGESAGYAFSQVRVTVSVDEEEAGAEVTVDANVMVLGDEWTLVPLAAAGVAISSVTDRGQPVGLVTRGGALYWPARGEGGHTLRWTYRVDAGRHGEGRVLPLATPPSTAQLTLTVPGSDRGVTVIPSTGVSTAMVGGGTRVTASLPATGGAQIAWRDRGHGGFTLSRAGYRGTLEGDVVRFEAELGVELEDDRARIPLFATSLALEDVRVDRAEAAIATEDGMYVIPVSGRGRHRITLAFQVPVIRDDGLPRFDLALTPTAVSRFEIAIPGERELAITPHTGVTTTRRDGRSFSVFHLPMSSSVSVRWSEAVPEDASEIEMRAHANLIHVIEPDEGVLSMKAYARWEITRGAMSRAELTLPEGVQVNAVTAAAGTDAVVSDWRVIEEGGERTLGVYLDREVTDALALEIEYEKSWPARTRTSETFDVPLLRAHDVHRQRGMVALLAARELTLDPREEDGLNRVGDNVLPANVRDTIEGTIAHTWRYLDEPPRLVAIGAIRDPEPARFDAQVDTLVSLGDVSTTVTTLIDVDVKSGTLDTLDIRVPEGLNLLEVSAPSLRHYGLREEGGARTLRVELTQPMEGHFRVEVVSERITGHEEELPIPLLGVEAAEVERGRLGVEALAPFQVDTAAVERLSPIDPSELPEQLLLRTDNPILHAYRYAQAEPSPRFTVRITRHAEIETPHALVDEATYRTLYTRDGVMVTSARFMVQNRRQQFLRLTLPDGSEVFSARVDGRAQTPALETGTDEDQPTVLLNIVSAAQAFPVELVYATPAAELGAFGRLRGQLPELDVVVTRTSWELFLPSGADYAAPVTSMNLVSAGGAVDAEAFGGVPEAMQVEIPSEGVRYVFSKMYAGRDGEPASFSLPYASGWGRPFVLGLSLLGALLLCLGLLAFAVMRLGFPVPPSLAERLPIPLATYRDHDDVLPPENRRARRALMTVGGTVLLGGTFLMLTLGYLSTSAWPAAMVAAAISLGALGMIARRKLEARRAAEEPEPDPEDGVAATAA